ncbi:MAG: acetyl-CoA C-acetyltransferase, partial [Methylocystaceae bacterium]
MQDVFVVSGKRTPIGDFLGTMKDLSNVDLGKIAAKAAMEQVGFKPEQVEHVVTGCVFQGGAKGNVSRQIQLGVNIPVEVGAVTVNQLCSSS